MVFKLSQHCYELPYYRDLNFGDSNRKKNLWSYGIICVSRENDIVINKSPPYIKTYLKKFNKYFHRANFRHIAVNTNEKYNLLLNSFSNSSLEGEYTLPKGKIDDMDKKNKIFTKVREFIEETKLTHPSFPYLLNQHYRDPNFKSFLNDESYIIRESWLGLNNKIYNCEYSVFVIDSMRELIPLKCGNTVPFNYFLTEFDVYQDCDKYYKKYKQSSNLDSQKTTIFAPIKAGIKLLNEHKINLINNNNYDSRLQISAIYNIISLSAL